MLHSLNSLIAQHTDDGQRFIDLGLPPQALTVSGNIKFDLCLDSGLQQKAIKLQRNGEVTGSASLVGGQHPSR